MPCDSFLRLETKRRCLAREIVQVDIFRSTDNKKKKKVKDIIDSCHNSIYYHVLYHNINNYKKNFKLL